MGRDKKNSAGVRGTRFIILALACFLPASVFGAKEQSFTGKVVDVECAGFGLVVKITVSSREGVTEQEAAIQRRPDTEEVRLEIGCRARQSSVRKFILKNTRKKMVTVRFNGVDRGNRPMADVLLPGGPSLRALVEARFPPPK